MKYILVIAYLATYGSENIYMELKTNPQLFDTSDLCTEMGNIMNQAAKPEMKFAYECIGIPDDGWF